MDAVTFAMAKAELSALLDTVIENSTAIEIVRHGKPSAVLMSKAEYDSIAETLYLHSSPANAARLRQGRLDVEAGRYTRKIVAGVNDD
jgi:antitoxin YefM